jgi:hypothetical protein
VECPALSAELLPLAKKYDDGGQAFKVMLRDELNPDLIDDPVAIGQMKHVGFLLKSWMEAVDKRALQLAVEEGKDVHGYDLAFRSPVAKVSDTQAAYEALSNMMSPEEFMGACKVTVAAIAKKVAEKKPRGEKKNARAEVEAALLMEGVMDDGGEGNPYLRKTSDL